MKVCYLTWGETPRSYGVFGSQVIEQFVRTKELHPNDEFYFISGVPIVNSGMTREKFKYGAELNNVKSKLKNIKFIWIPIFAPQNLIYSKVVYYKSLFFGMFLLNKKLKKINPDILHCRSYATSMIALELKKKYNYNYKIIFDARGLFPEEYALKMNFTENDANYLYFKNMEKQLLQECDIVIGVSDTMKKYYAELGAKNATCIYLSANVDKLYVQKDINTTDTIVFGYVGALSESTWHKTTELLKLYKHLRKLVKNSRIHIITTSSHSDIASIFNEIPSEEIYLSSTKTTDELKSELQKFDFGLMSYFNADQIFEKKLSEMVLAVKSVEYLAAGLPLIVNEKCGGIAHIINKFDLGIAYNPDDLSSSIDSVSIVKYINDNSFERRAKLAKELFDYNNNAQMYSQIYHSLS